MQYEQSNQVKRNIQHSLLLYHGDNFIQYSTCSNIRVDLQNLIKYSTVHLWYVCGPPTEGTQLYHD